MQIYFDAINTRQEISCSYNTGYKFPLRLVANESGFVQLWSWENNQWNVIWYEPKNLCDKIGNCGPNAICNSQNKSICSCLPGYTDKWPNGCTRKTLNCDYTNKFVNFSGIKLPDTSTVAVHKGLSFSNCQAVCFAKCYCTAFAFVDYGNQCMIWSANLSDISLHSDTGHSLYVSLSGDNNGISKVIQFT